MPATVLSSVNEGSTAYVTVSFTDELGTAIVPSSISIKVNDVITSTELMSSTVTTPGTSSYTVTLTPTANRIINDNHEYEEHVLTIDATYETGKHCTGEYRFNVYNLRFLT